MSEAYPGISGAAPDIARAHPGYNANNDNNKENN